MGMIKQDLTVDNFDPQEVLNLAKEVDSFNARRRRQWVLWQLVATVIICYEGMMGIHYTNEIWIGLVRIVLIGIWGKIYIENVDRANRHKMFPNALDWLKGRLRGYYLVKR